MPALFRSGLRALALPMFVALSLPSGVTAQSNMFCGGPSAPSSPSDLEHTVGELSLQHSAQQPASMLTCAHGYLLEKCGDHETALKIFDKCIAAGYVGAMIWKGLMYEAGNGLPQDLSAAAELFRRAAESGDPAYAKLGMLHYASALQQGLGVPRDEALARHWFERAAQAGSDDADEFLRTGYHSGGRDFSGMGVGTPTAAALAPLRAQPADNGTRAQQSDAPTPHRASARRLGGDSPPPAPAPAAALPADAVEMAQLDLAREVHGQRLERSPPDTPASEQHTDWPLWIALSLFFAGLLRQSVAPFFHRHPDRPA